MKYPLISIVIPTYNSAKTLRDTLMSIKKQTYPKNRIEILVIDGNSVDKTLSIAKEFNCKILQNKGVEMTFGKQIGFNKAQGKYILYLDSDEMLDSPKSLMLKINAFKVHSQVKSVILSGYKTPKYSSPVNYYINDFGDPFSFFMYKESKSDTRLLKEWPIRFKDGIISNDANSMIIDFSQIKILPMIELWAGGNMFDLEYVKKEFPQLKNNPNLIALLFYLLNKRHKFVAITKGDFTIHDSTPNLSKYLKKIVSRIKNNIFNTDMGKGGYTGREKFDTSWLKVKKYLFIPYSFSLVFPFFDALYLSISRKRTIYLLHPFLCIYTSIFILYYYALRAFHISPKMTTYGI